MFVYRCTIYYSYSLGISDLKHHALDFRTPEILVGQFLKPCPVFWKSRHLKFALRRKLSLIKSSLGFVLHPLICLFGLRFSCT